MEILIEESEGALWAAAIDHNHKIQALEVDTPQERVRWGDIYVAIVKTIDKARDAAFLDLGDGQTGILYAKNIRKTAPDGSIVKGGDVPIGKMLNAGEALIVQAKAAYIQSDTLQSDFENKIPEVSMDISLQGRHLIYCPFLQRAKISQRIAHKPLREKLRKMLTDLGELDGIILRASAAHQQTDILRRESKILQEEWRAIANEANGLKEPYRIALGIDSAQRLLSDIDTDLEGISAIEVVTQDHLDHVIDWCSLFAPELMAKITPVEVQGATEDLALFYARDIMNQVDSLTKPYYALPDGGSLILQATAALTAIDVNKGTDARSHVQTNLSAVTEAFRQIRLRNIGGVVMLDLLTMKKAKDIETVLKHAKIEAAKDPCTVQIHGLTNTGLLEISRKRRIAPLKDRISL